MASLEEALINSFRAYPALYDMSLKDYKDEKLKGNIWQKIAEEMRAIGFDFSGKYSFRKTCFLISQYFLSVSSDPVK